MSFLAALDVYQKPQTNALKPKTRAGGTMVILAVICWAGYSGYTIYEFLETPDVITVASKDSDFFADQIAYVQLESPGVVFGRALSSAGPRCVCDGCKSAAGPFSCSYNASPVPSLYSICICKYGKSFELKEMPIMCVR